MTKAEEIDVLKQKLSIVIDFGIKKCQRTAELKNESLEELSNILRYSVTQEAGCFLSSKINANNAAYHPSNQRVSVNFSHDPKSRLVVLEFTGEFGLSTQAEINEKNTTQGIASASGGLVSFGLKMEIKTDTLSATVEARKGSIASFEHQQNLSDVSINTTAVAALTGY